eukprot:tig00000792_g4154.t1
MSLGALEPPPEPPSWSAWVDGAVGKLEEARLLRDLRAIAPSHCASGHADAAAVRVRLAARPVEPLVLFSSNDYLGLSTHPAVRDAAAEAVREYGMGPRGSALICGYSSLHQALERRLAQLKRTEEALLFPTGFAANMGALASLGGPDVAIFSDELNHASIVDGCRLAVKLGATLRVYRHRDVRELARMLREERDSGRGRRLAIVSDSVFSMDGDLAPLAELSRLRSEFGALLIVDEAHSTLVFSDSPAGTAQHGPGFLPPFEADLRVGTLSKAAGCLGGFVACSAQWKRWLLNRGRAYVYSTSLPLPVVAGGIAAVDASEADGAAVRRRLWRRVAQFASETGLRLESPIVPIVVGDESRALSAAAALLEKGFHVVAIRPPTVPKGTCRLRIALSAAHSEQDVSRLAAALRQMRLVPRAEPRPRL